MNDSVSHFSPLFDRQFAVINAKSSTNNEDSCWGRIILFTDTYFSAISCISR